MVRLQRAQAHLGDTGGAVANGNSVQQVKVLSLAVGGQVDAHQYDLFNAVGGQVLHFFFQVRRRLGAHTPPGFGDNAVGAKTVTAVLNFYKGAHALPKAADGAGGKGVAGLVGVNVHNAAFFCMIPVDDGKNITVALVREYNVCVQLGLGLLRERLGHTAGEDHRCARVTALKAAHALAGLLVRSGGYRTRVDDVVVRFLIRGHNLKTGAAQQLGHIFTFILVDFAAKGVKSSFHIYYAPIHDIIA